MKHYFISQLPKMLLILCFWGILTQAHAQWKQTNGPVGDFFFDLLENNGRIWGAAVGGLFYSDDEGETWKHHPDISFDDYVYSIIKYKGALYASVERGGADASSPFEYSLLRSDDDGETWVPVSYLGTPAGIYRVKAHRDQLIQYSWQNVKYSTDNGLHWAYMLFPDVDISTATYQFDDNTFLIRYSDYNIFASQDLGQSWTIVANPAQGFYELAGLRGNEIMAKKSEFVPAPHIGYYYTKNLGQTWEKLSDPFPSSMFSTSYQFWGSDTILATSQSFLGQKQISTNAGQSWQAWTEWGNEGFLPEIITADGGLNARTQKFYAATNSVETRSAGLINNNAIDLQSNGERLFVSVQAEGYFSSMDEGITWEKLPLDYIWGSEDQIAVSGDTLYTCAKGKVYFATQNGLSGWNILADALDFYQISELTVSGNYLILEKFTEPIVLHRFTGAAHPPINFPASFCVLAIQGDRYIAGKSDTPVAWISDNEGQTWTQVLDESNENGGKMIVLEDRILYFSYYNLYSSTDQGLSWSSMELTDFPTYPWLFDSAHIIPAAVVIENSILYAALDDYGVYKSVDFGANWEPFNEDLGALRNNSLITHNGHLILGTHTSGVWRNASLSSAVFNPVAPERLALSPNPSSGQLTVQLPEGQGAQLRCYNAMGLLIFEKSVQGGANTLDLQAYPNGIYQIIANGAGRTFASTIVLQR